MRSVSLFGLSYVGVYFDDDVDIYFARRLVGEKLQEVKGRLPAGYGEPVLGPNSSGLGQVFWYTIEDADKKLSAMDLRTLHDWTVRLILRTAPGVDDVTTWGGHEKQFQVQIDPQRLVKYGLSFKDVMERLAANNKQVGGQYLNIGAEQYLVRGLGLVEQRRRTSAPSSSPSANGAPIYVRDVATVKEAPAVRFGAVTRNGQETVLGIALARINENAASVVKAVKAKLATAQAALPPNVKLKPVYDRTEIVDKALVDLDQRADRGLDPGRDRPVPVPRRAALGDRRHRHPAAGDAVRLHLHAALRHVGEPDVARGAGDRHRHDGRRRGRHGRERVPLAVAARESPASRSNRTDVVLQAAREVANPIAFAILIIIVVFLPLFSLDRPRGQALQADGADHHLRDGRLAAAVADAGAGAGVADPEAQGGEGHLARPRRQAALPAAARLGARARRRSSSAPRSCCLSARWRSSRSWARSSCRRCRKARSCSASSASRRRRSTSRSASPTSWTQGCARSIRRCNSVLATIGRAEKGETADVNYMEVLLDLKPQEEWPTKQSYAALGREMQEFLEGEVQTVVFGATQPIQMRVEELISGVRATLALKVYGPDLDALEIAFGAAERRRSAASRASRTCRRRPTRASRRLVIKVDRAAAARYGLNADDILVGRAGGHRRRDRLDPDRRHAALRHRGAAGGRVPQQPVGDRRDSDSHLRGRTGAVLAGGEHRARRGLHLRPPRGAAAVRGAADGCAGPRRRRLRAGRQRRHRARASSCRPATGSNGAAHSRTSSARWRVSALIVPLTIGLIFILLYTAFNSVRHATLIIANVPFAIIGGLVGLFITGQYLSVPSAIGFIAVFGVAMLNGIVLVTFLNDQRRQDCRFAMPSVRARRCGCGRC